MNTIAKKSATPNTDARAIIDFENSSLSVLVSRTDERDTREIVVHPDGDITHLWDGER